MTEEQEDGEAPRTIEDDERMLHALQDMLVDNSGGDSIMVMLSDFHREDCMEQWAIYEAKENPEEDEPECICEIGEAEAKTSALSQYLDAIMEERRAKWKSR